VHERLESLVEAVTAIIDQLETARIPYAFGGAIALSAWSEPRATTDVDLNLWVDEAELPAALDTLRRAGVELDAAAAVSGARERGMFAGQHGSYRIDVFVPSVPFYEEALRRKQAVRLADRDTWVLSPESLAVFKMLFFRPKDLVDLARLIEVQVPPLDGEFVRGWLVDMVGVSDPRVTKWDELTGRPRRKPAPKKKRR
jgi:hypothetical protein